MARILVCIYMDIYIIEVTVMVSSFEGELCTYVCLYIGEDTE